MQLLWTNCLEGNSLCQIKKAKRSGLPQYAILAAAHVALTSQHLQMLALNNRYDAQTPSPLLQQ